MKVILGIFVVFLSSLLVLFSSYANISDVKITKAKPDVEITEIEDYSNSDEINNNSSYKKESTTGEQTSNTYETVKPKNKKIETVEKNKEIPIEPYQVSNPRSTTELKNIVVPEYKDSNQKPYRTVLLMGTDVVRVGNSYSTKGRTDAIMLAKISDSKIDLLSIPRDSYVHIKGYGHRKINSANVYGGPELLKDTIENWLKVKIDDYILINTAGVTDMIDLFGGIDFNIPKRMRYYDYTGKLFINLYPGMQHLDGRKVHDFLRFRNDALGDLNRVKREQEVIKTLVNQFLKPSNLLKIPSAFYILNKNIETNMSVSKMVFMAKSVLQNEDLKNKISMQTLPGSGKMYNGAWYWFINKDESTEMLTDLSIVETDKNINLEKNSSDETQTE